jgi:hypothetical protein
MKQKGLQECQERNCLSIGEIRKLSEKMPEDENVRRDQTKWKVSGKLKMGKK